MNTPAVSVILPTYNRAHLLGRAIRSVLAQTWRDLELIVVDDGSTDSTRELIREFDDPRLRYEPMPRRGSAAIARNAGLRLARADLVAFQDSDDEWLVDKLRRQMAVLREAPVDTGLICAGYLVRPLSGMPWYQGADTRMQHGDWDASNIYHFTFITPTWLVRRAAIEDAGLFDEELPNLEDWELAFRLFRCCRIVAMDEPLVLKNGADDSLNRVHRDRAASLQTIIERHADLWQTHPATHARLHDDLGRLLCRLGEMAGGRAALRRALKLDPRSARRWAHYVAALGGARAYAQARRLFA